MNEVFQFHEFDNGQNIYSLPKGSVITFKEGTGNFMAGKTLVANDPNKKWTQSELDIIASVKSPDGVEQVLSETPASGQGTDYVKSGDGEFYEVKDGEYARVGDANTLKELENGKLEATNVFYTGDQLLGKEPLPSGDVSGALAAAQGNATGGGGGTSAAGNQALQDVINQAGLDDDQKSAIDLIYEAIASNDKDLMERAKAAMAAATEFSEPFFKAQARLAIDTLDRSLTGREDDLAFREEQISSALGDLRNDIQSAGDFLSFQQQQELKGLERQYDQTLKVTQEDLAARGFTQSSVRSRKEQLLTDTFGDLRQSSDRSFTEKQTQLTNQQTRADRDTTAEIERLRELTEKGKIDDLRKTEQFLGTDALNGVGYNDNLLGDLPGQLERDKLNDATAFASGSGLIF